MGVLHWVLPGGSCRGPPLGVLYGILHGILQEIVQHLLQSCPPEKQRNWGIYTQTPFSYCLRAEYINSLAIAPCPQCGLNTRLWPEKA